MISLTRSTPTFSLDAVLHDKLYTSTKMFSIHDMEYFLWVKVDPEIVRYFDLYQLDEVGETEKFDINLSDICEHEHRRIWYKINSMMLNRKPGQHVYRMHMVNRVTENTISLYFSYIVQREDTDKPYIYMQNLKSEETRLK